jgi:hypothetical protein
MFQSYMSKKPQTVSPLFPNEGGYNKAVIQNLTKSRSKRSDTPQGNP